MTALTKTKTRIDVKTEFDLLCTPESGTLPLTSLRKLFRKLNLPHSDQELVKAQLAFETLCYSDEPVKKSQEPTFEENDKKDVCFPIFWKWYKLEHCKNSYDHVNALLVRRTISKVKLPTRNLREGTFAYGAKNIPDAEGSGEVIFKWVTGTRSKSKKSGVSMLKVNKAAVRMKQVTPKTFNEFYKKHHNDPKLQKTQPEEELKNKKQISKIERDQVYGKPSPPQEYKSLNEVIFPKRTVETKTDSRRGEEDKSQPYLDISGQVLKGKIPLPRPTHFSKLQLSELKRKKDEIQERKLKDNWKLKRFLDVKPKVPFPKA
eukprot:snap_masked-scaffold_4-processed-gene-5.57-mRNA-1 protein AED:1.00 eAED:1.00 QI:0/-1/0/0/-1/1/1/0/317